MKALACARTLRLCGDEDEEDGQSAELGTTLSFRPSLAFVLSLSAQAWRLEDTACGEGKNSFTLRDCEAPLLPLATAVMSPTLGAARRRRVSL